MRRLLLEERRRARQEVPPEASGALASLEAGTCGMQVAWERIISARIRGIVDIDHRPSEEQLVCNSVRVRQQSRRASTVGASSAEWVQTDLAPTAPSPEVKRGATTVETRSDALGCPANPTEPVRADGALELREWLVTSPSG